VQAANLSSWTGDYNHPDWARFSQAVYGSVRGDAPQAHATPQQQPPPQAAWQQPQQQQQSGGWQTQAPPQMQGGGWQGATPGGGVEQLSPVGYVQKCLRLFIDGKGRARRAEYWWWVAFSVIVSVIASIIDLAFGLDAYGQPNSQILSTVASLALLAPSASVTSRRFHDVGLSGWLVAGVFGAYVIGGALMGMQNVLGSVIVLIAALAALVVAVTPSKPGSNQYGPNPKGL